MFNPFPKLGFYYRIQFHYFDFEVVFGGFQAIWIMWTKTKSSSSTFWTWMTTDLPKTYGKLLSLGSNFIS